MLKSIAAPVATPLSVFPDGAPYPFEEIVGREEEEAELRTWLLAEGSAGGPLGGAALVTGFRGVGKTSLVNKVLFDVGLAALHGVEMNGSDWGPFDANARERFKKDLQPGRRRAVPIGRSGRAERPRCPNVPRRSLELAGQ